VAREIVAVEPGTSQDLILDLRHTLVRVAPAESDAANQPPRWLVFRAPAVGGSGPGIRAGAPPELCFDLEGGRIECQLRDAAGWQERDGAAVALYEAPVGAESFGSGPTGGDAKWALRWGSDELSGEVAAASIQLLIGHQAGRG
jgi:hypothetical protein